MSILQIINLLIVLAWIVMMISIAIPAIKLFKTNKVQCFTLIGLAILMTALIFSII